MTILCAPVPGGLKPQTEEALNTLSLIWWAYHELEVVWLDPDDRYAYWRAIKERWNGQRLLIIEQDMVFGNNMVTDLMSCQQDWCMYGYTIGQARNTGCLGFTRFSAAVTSLIDPDKLEAAMMACPICRGEYWHLDFHITDTARVCGFWPHDHGDIEHLHTYEPPTKVMEVGNMTSAEYRGSITEFMKARGWKGPSAYNGHEHTSDCACVWTE